MQKYSQHTPQESRWKKNVVIQYFLMEVNMGSSILLWVEINLKNLISNLYSIKSLLPKGVAIAPCVKADAYGHGAIEISKALVHNGIDMLSVGSIDEGMELKKAGLTCKILIMGFTHPDRYRDLVKYGFIQTIYSLAAALELSEAAEKMGKIAKIFIKIDTGMKRIGMEPTDESLKIISQIKQQKNIAINGIFTHFACADSLDKTFTYFQFDAFERFCQALSVDVKCCYKSCSNSAAIINHPHFLLKTNLVRPGIILYGLYPSDEVDKSKIALKPVMSFKTQVVHVKQINAGDSVGYGRKFIAKDRTIIASLPVGYSDGYTRLLSAKAEVLIHGKRAPIVGSICMSQCMIDVTAIQDVKVGDEVVLFGQQGDETITVDDLALLIGSINYEILCMVNPRVPKIYHSIPSQTAELEPTFGGINLEDFKAPECFEIEAMLKDQHGTANLVASSI